ncbi:MAG TPA: FecR domain-containing protein [Turneriella sp.]|nr:FecR domain-containing protein [Turneriella sp.]
MRISNSHFRFMSSAAVLLLVAGACTEKAPTTDGVIAVVKGSAVIEHIEADGTKKTRAARAGEKVFATDAIVTADSSDVIFEVQGARMEIQQNTRFVYERSDVDKQVYVQHGNVWTEVSKIEGHRRFALRTPTTIAAVRGTKFFTFTDGTNTGTCHCEGKIAFKNLVSGKEEENDRDYIMYYRDKKAVKVTVEELKKIGLPVGHNHSELDKGSIGKKNNLSPAQMKKMQDYVDKKFAALR